MKLNNWKPYYLFTHEEREQLLKTGKWIEILVQTNTDLTPQNTYVIPHDREVVQHPSTHEMVVLDDYRHEIPNSTIIGVIFYPNGGAQILFKINRLEVKKNNRNRHKNRKI